MILSRDQYSFVILYDQICVVACISILDGKSAETAVDGRRRPCAFQTIWSRFLSKNVDSSDLSCVPILQAKFLLKSKILQIDSKG